MNRHCVAILSLLILALIAPQALAMGFTDETLIPQSGVVGKPFLFQLKGRNGMQPYTFQWAGKLPPGLTISKSGLIQGTPTEAGEFKYWVHCHDSSGKRSERPLTISIAPSSLPPTIADWQKPDWNLVWFDEFDAGVPDMGHWSWGYQGQSDKMRANYKIDHSLLHLRLEKDAPAPQLTPLPRPEKTGRVSSFETQAFFMQQYGLFEVRAKMPKGPGAKTLIWMSPRLAYEKTKADGGARESENDPMELDVFEHSGDSPNALAAAIHYGRGFGEGHQVEQKKFDVPVSLEDDFHFYGLEWNEKSLVWFVDGKEVGRSDKPPHAPLFLRLSIFEDGGPVEGKDFQVDCVRVYSKSPIEPAQLVR